MAEGHHASEARKKIAVRLQLIRRRQAVACRSPTASQPPSGKARIYSEELSRREWTRSRHSSRRTSRASQDAAAKYPLELLARKADNFLNSTFANLPGHQQEVGDGNYRAAEINGEWTPGSREDSRNGGECGSSTAGAGDPAEDEDQ